MPTTKDHKGSVKDYFFFLGGGGHNPVPKAISRSDQNLRAVEF